jgi:hypothetical protein
MEQIRIFNFILRIVTLMGLSLTMYIYSMAQSKSANGSAQLWERRYNEVAYPATHNGQSHIDSAVQNQSLPLLEQLEKGIRATKIHVWQDFDKNSGSSAAFVCHGVTKELLEGAYLEKVVEKVPRMFRGWAQDILKQMEPVNELIRDACRAAYGEGDKDGMIPFKHCILDPSKRTLATLLGEVKQFMDKNPHEVITLILEDHTKNLDRLAQDFEKSGLNSYVHAQDINEQWPKLGAMISSNKRLVVFVHGADDLPYNKYPWMHYIWNFAWDTEWDFRDASDLRDQNKDTMPKRGVAAFQARKQGPKNKVFIVNHFVTPLTGGSKSEAKKANRKSCLQSRIDRLVKASGQIPNIIQVDFFQDPGSDIFDVVQSLNADKKYIS